MKRTVSALLFLAVVGLSGLLLRARAAEQTVPKTADSADRENLREQILILEAKTREAIGDVADPEIANLRRQYLDIQKDLANGLSAEELRARIQTATHENQEVWVKLRLAKIVEQLEKVKQDFPETTGARTAQTAINVIMTGANDHGHGHQDLGGQELPPPGNIPVDTFDTFRQRSN